MIWIIVGGLIIVGLTVLWMNFATVVEKAWDFSPHLKAEYDRLKAEKEERKK